MNRNLYHPFTVGAIMIWIIMALSISIPLMTFIPLLCLFFTLHIIYNSKISYYSLIIIFSIFLGLIGVYRISIENSRYFIPVTNLNSFIGDVKVVKDSNPTNSGYITNGIIYSIKTSQIESRALEPIIIFSKFELYSGMLLKDLKIKIGDRGYSSTTEQEKMVFSSRFYEFRSLIFRKLKNRTPSPLLIALITGNKGGLSREQIDLFRRSGCSHILALSGFHVSIITLLIILIMRLFLTGMKVYIVSIIVLILYLIFVGVTPSLLRSVFMFITAICSQGKRIKIPVLRILVISYLITIIILPNEFYTLSFQLSYLALAGILTLGDEIKRLPILKKLPSLFVLPISASIAAMLATSFICFPIFGTLYPVGILASVLLTPIITIYIWLGLVSIIIPKLSFLILYIEEFTYFLLSKFGNSPVIDKTLLISPLITLIPTLIPVILLIIKLYRRMNAGRFNLKFKL